MGERGPFQDGAGIEADALTVARGGRILCEGLSFVAGAGDYVEIHGANGAGKTSLLRAIAGFLKPRAGAVRFAAEEPALALHYLGHFNGVKGTASPRAHLAYWRGLFGGAADIDAALDRVGLMPQADLPVRVLSQGQVRRLALGRFLIAPRPIWLMDEPAAALDGQGRDALRAMIERQRADGGAVLAAVHEALGPQPAHVLTMGAE